MVVMMCTRMVMQYLTGMEVGAQNASWSQSFRSTDSFQGVSCTFVNCALTKAVIGLATNPFYLHGSVRTKSGRCQSGGHERPALMGKMQGLWGVEVLQSPSCCSGRCP